MTTPNSCHPGDPHRFNDFNSALRQTQEAFNAIRWEADRYPHLEKAEAMEKLARRLIRQANKTRKESR